jgi:hypothetical protein
MGVVEEVLQPIHTKKKAEFCNPASSKTFRNCS